MAAVLVWFVAASVVLWLSVYGYLLLLAALAYTRRRARARIVDWPAVALVVPTLNEEGTIDAKLVDLARTAYPTDQLRVVVVDGGSVDRTVARVRAAIAGGARLELWQVAARGSKASQVNYAMERLREPLVVVTDADARLDPSCVRELIGTLLDDPHAAIVGASIRVTTDLPEERLHWWAINQLWWLEGEALSAAMVSGVCYAVRRATLVAAAHDARAEDAHLSLRAAAQGLHVRLSRAAWATEVRAPRDAWELFRFRRRRGTDYLRELQRFPAAALPLGPRLVRAVRLFHFRVTPWLATVTVGMALALFTSPHWPWLLAAGLAFAFPPALVLSRAPSLRTEGSRWSLVPTAGRLAGLLWISLLAIRSPREALASKGDARMAPMAARVANRWSARSLVSIDRKAAS